MTLTEHAADAVRSTPSFVRTLWQTTVSFVPALLLLCSILGWIEDSTIRRPVLIGALAVYAFATWHLLSGVLNPTVFFAGLKDARGLYGQMTPVGYVARSVSVLIVSFVVVYGVDNVVRTLSLDLAETFRFDLSTIEHGDRWLTCAFVFAFRTTLGLSAIALIVEAVRRYPHWR